MLSPEQIKYYTELDKLKCVDLVYLVVQVHPDSVQDPPVNRWIRVQCGVFKDKDLCLRTLDRVRRAFPQDRFDWTTEIVH